MTNSELKSLRGQLSDIYRDMRNVCMTRRHYDQKLRTVQHVNTWYEGLLAVGTSGTVAGWSFWKEATGQAIWIGVGVFVSILSIIKPIIRLSEEVKRLSTLAAKYAALQVDFQLLVFDIKADCGLSESSRKIYKEICKKMTDLGEREDTPPSEKRLAKLCEQVNREFPPSSFWSPE